MLFTRRELNRLVWPLIGEQILAVTVGMADTVMVAYCGEAAMSGVALSDSVYWNTEYNAGSAVLYAD